MGFTARGVLPGEMSRRKRFGENLVEAEVLDQAILAKALAQQKVAGKCPDQVLEEGGIVSERDIAVVVRQFGLKTVINPVRLPAGAKRALRTVYRPDPRRNGA